MTRFTIWHPPYHGLLDTVLDDPQPRPQDAPNRDLITSIRGYSHPSDAPPNDQGVAHWQNITDDGPGTAYVYLHGGDGDVRNERSRTIDLEPGMFYSDSGPLTFGLAPGASIVVVRRENFRGPRILGGPIEPAGRLRYIDGCTDSLLVPPVKLGDPCLNHLHFPPGINQTDHTHPSSRAGMIVRGSGECIVPMSEVPPSNEAWGIHPDEVQDWDRREIRVPLTPGAIWHIPRGTTHRFATLGGQPMDVIAYHPDSDFGPTDEDHPMLNRTWVDGTAIDNTTAEHTPIDKVEG